MVLPYHVFPLMPRRIFPSFLLLLAAAAVSVRGTGRLSEAENSGNRASEGALGDQLKLLQTGNSTEEFLERQGPQDSGRSGPRRRLLEDSEDDGERLQGSWDGQTDGQRDSGLPDQFIYVYELSTKYNIDLVNSRINYWTSMYEAEDEVFEMLAQKGVHRTLDPEAATLFYVPFFACRFLHVYFSDIDALNDNRKWSELHVGFNATSIQYTQLLKELRREYPYFNRSNGRDHFAVLSQDHGRCGAIPFVNPVLYGEMFFIQLNGDKMVQSNYVQTERGMQVLNFNWGVGMVRSDIPAIPCYMMDRDIVVPSVVRNVVLVPEGEGERPMHAVFRFSRVMDHGVKVPFWGHYVRTELFELFANKGIEGFDFGAKSASESWEDWKHATFCAAPPGHSQWTARLFKVIFAGCIPITFFQQHDNPWQDDIDYELFSVNIGVNELPTLKDRLDEILGDPARLKRMQHEVTKVQELFMWGESGGVWKLLAKSLQHKALKLHAKKQRLRGVDRSTPSS